MVLDSRLGGKSPFSELIATSLLKIVYRICSLASFLCSSGFHSIVVSMLCTLDLFQNLLQTVQICSNVYYKRIWLLCAGPYLECVCPSAYKGPIQWLHILLLVLLVSELYDFCCVVVKPMLRFLRRNPYVLFAFPHMLLMWFVQLRSDVIIQPRYFALFTDFKV